MSGADCERVLRQIEVYLDGELVGVERLEVERHLVGCSPCSDHSEFQRRLKEILRAKCGCEHAPAELLERMQALLSAQHPHLPPS